MIRLVDLIQEKNAEQFINIFLEKMSEKVMYSLQEEKVFVADSLLYEASRKRGVKKFNDEHAHVLVWNHLVGASHPNKRKNIKLHNDKEAMLSEIQKAREDENHPLHFKNAKNEGFSGGKKTEDHRESYYSELESAVHAVHSLSNSEHEDIKHAVANGHKAIVTGAAKGGQLSDLYKKHGVKDKTPKTDIGLVDPKDPKKGVGIRISLKKSGGSQLMSSGPEEASATFHHAASEMLNEHPDYAHLPEHKKSEIHKNIMTRIKKTAALAHSMRTSTSEEEREKIKNSMQKHLDSIHEEHPILNNFVRREATTGWGKFGKDSPHSASYIVTSGHKGSDPKITNLHKVGIEAFAGPKVRAGGWKGEGRPGTVRADNK
jgi:hypothetical protein